MNIRNFIVQRICKYIPDKIWLQMKYYKWFRKIINFKNPKTFNEKLQWLKLYDRKEEYIKMVDKYEAKKFVSEIIGKEYIIPTIGIYDKFEEINFNALPDKFVIKCTHDCGGLVICKDKNNFDIEKAKKKIKEHMKTNYFWGGREWPYKNIEPRIIVEKYMEDIKTKQIIDYKFFCFNGEPEICLVCSDRASNLKETWFDKDWNNLNIIEGKHDNDDSLEKPINFEKMKELSKKLSTKTKFIRVDFYEINGLIYFGELTLYPASGYERFSNNKWDNKLGDLIVL